jgi:hypothetical protein
LTSASHAIVPSSSALRQRTPVTRPFCLRDIFDSHAFD